MSALDERIDLARTLAREAARRAPRALARVVDARTVRSQLDTESPVARTAAKEGVQVTLRVEGPRGLGSAEEWLGATERPRSVLRSALAAARTARDGASLEAALALGAAAGARLHETDAAAFAPPIADLLAAFVAGARRVTRAPLGAAIDVTVEQTRTVLALGAADGERLHVRSRVGVAVEGELADGESSTKLGLAHELAEPGDWPRVLRAARASGEDAARRLGARTTTVPIGSPRLLLLAPEVVTWILHGTLVEGFALARAGGGANVPSWLDVDDPGARDPLPDEQGVVPAAVPLVRGGAWLRGPFRAFDGTGRTFRDDRSAIARASLAGLLLRAAEGAPAERRAKLAARADAVLGEVASADPLPGGGVFVVARAARRRGRRFVPAGLAGVRLDAGELAARTVAVSREVEPVYAQDLPVTAPWLAVRGVKVREA